MNGPSALLISGKLAARSRSASVTNVAMMRMYEVIRTSCAMYFFNSETKRPEPTSTNVVATPIAIPLARTFVTAIVGHMPSIWTSTGFSDAMPRHVSAHTVAGGGAPGMNSGAGACGGGAGGVYCGEGATVVVTSFLLSDMQQAEAATSRRRD